MTDAQKTRLRRVLLEMRQEAGLSQREVGERLGGYTGESAQSVISQRERDRDPTEISVDFILAFDAALGHPPGTALRRAKLLRDPHSTKDAIAVDPDLDSGSRQALLGAYNAFRTVIRQRRAARGGADGRQR